MTTANDFVKGVRLAQAHRLKLRNPWRTHPDHSWKDWQNEVANQDTLLGYWDWVFNRIEMGEE